MDSVGPLLWWMTALIGLLIVGWFAAVQVKKRLRVDEPEHVAPAGFTLSDLRAMHKSGKMTDDEFERAKEVVLAVAKRQADKPDPKIPPADKILPDDLGSDDPTT